MRTNNLFRAADAKTGLYERSDLTFHQLTGTMIMSKNKKPTPARRNHVVMVARTRNGGHMRHKGDRRRKDRAARELRDSY